MGVLPKHDSLYYGISLTVIRLALLLPRQWPAGLGSFRAACIR
jgi:hypothetical protein